MTKKTSLINSLIASFSVLAICFIAFSYVGASGGEEVEGSGDVGAGTTGQTVYYASNGTAVTATSAIFIDTSSNVGIGASTNLSKLTVQDTMNAATGNESAMQLNYTTNKAAGNDTGLLINQTDTASPGTSNLFDAQVGSASKFKVSNTGRTTWANNVFLAGTDYAGTDYVNMFKVNASDQIEVGATLSLGDTFNVVEDGGLIRLINQNVTASASAGTDEGYTFAIDNTDIMTVFAESDEAGGIQNQGVGIGTTTPASMLDVNGGIRPSQVTADPCGSGYPEGTLFYNDTSNYFCFCDGTNDVQMASTTQACF